MAFFCVVEGIDGSGKSTLIKHLQYQIETQIKKKNIPFTAVHTLHEPSSFPTGQKIRSLLREKSEIPTEEWLKLFLLDRLEHYDKITKDLLKDNVCILQDRYFYSTAAYQGSSENEAYSPQKIIKRHESYGLPTPDLLVFLHIPEEEALSRLHKRGKSLENFENLEKLQKVQSNYLKILPNSTLRLDYSCAKGFDPIKRNVMEVYEKISTSLIQK